MYLMTGRIGFVGTGQMGRALAGGFVRAGLVSPEQVIGCDPSAAAAEQFLAAIPDATVVASNSAVIADAEVVFLAIKPQQIESVLREIAAAGSHEALFVSIAAGVPLAKLTRWLGSDRVIRVMPNTPCLIGKGASGYCAGPGASSEDRKLVGELLGSVGLATEIPEKLMDALTAVSGSGPAYVYTFIEALSDGGVKMGLPRDVATALAAHTVLGAADMVLETNEHTAVLRDRVTSPGGTTIAGLAAMEQGGFRAAVLAAVEAAARRSLELGQD
jgi:pyrroline-5-carboxylate reductase